MIWAHCLSQPWDGQWVRLSIGNGQGRRKLTTWDIFNGKVATQWVVEYYQSVDELRNCSYWATGIAGCRLVTTKELFLIACIYSLRSDHSRTSFNKFWNHKCNSFQKSIEPSLWCVHKQKYIRWQGCDPVFSLSVVLTQVCGMATSRDIARKGLYWAWYWYMCWIWGKS